MRRERGVKDSEFFLFLTPQAGSPTADLDI
jgi:hypothetical protein